MKHFEADRGKCFKHNFIQSCLNCFIVEHFEKVLTQCERHKRPGFYQEGIF